jgi:hypothetical protein
MHISRLAHFGVSDTYDGVSCVMHRENLEIWQVKLVVSGSGRPSKQYQLEGVDMQAPCGPTNVLGIHVVSTVARVNDVEHGRLTCLACVCHFEVIAQ